MKSCRGISLEQVVRFWRLFNVLKLEKLCDQLLKRTTTNKYTVKDPFSCAKEVQELDPNPATASVDIKSLFTIHRKVLLVGY